MRPAVFLDRDGVVNETEVRDGAPRPPGSLTALRIPDDAPGAVSALRDAGYVLVVVTNQPDIARGTTTRSAVDEINAALVAELGLDAVYVCPHDNADRCRCRKPRPGMLVDAARDLDLDLGHSWLIGDRWVDIGAAAAVGVRSVLIERGYSWRAAGGALPPPDLRPTQSVASLADGVHAILDGG